MSQRYKKISKGLNVDKLKGSLEKSVYKDLRSIQVEYKFDISYERDRLKYTLHRTYIPDFTVSLASGRSIYIETKGYLRPDDRAKLLAARESNPDKDIRIVFMTDNKLSKGSKTRYSDWALKHNFTFAIGKVPREWLSE